MNKIFIKIMILILSLPAQAGLNGLTHHSRARCLNNESVSWDAFHRHDMVVISRHKPDNGIAYLHSLRSNKSGISRGIHRAAAVCWGEALKPLPNNPSFNWFVDGTHFYYDAKGEPHNIHTNAGNCNIYNGWWDFEQNSMNELYYSGIFDFLNTPTPDGKRREVRVSDNYYEIIVPKKSNEIDDILYNNKKYKNGINIIDGNQSSIYETNINQMNEQNVNGYYYSNDNYINVLLNYRKYADKQSKFFGLIKNPFRTVLRDNIKDINLAFEFNPISFIPKENIIGISPHNTYNEDKKGWSGIKEFFEYSGIGTCSYSVLDFNSFKGQIFILKEKITYKVNNKITRISIKGNKQLGFMYFVSWVDKNQDKELTCASLKFSNENIEKIVELAKRIDLDSNS